MNETTNDWVTMKKNSEVGKFFANHQSKKLMAKQAWFDQFVAAINIWVDLLHQGIL